MVSYPFGVIVNTLNIFIGCYVLRLLRNHLKQWQTRSVSYAYKNLIPCTCCASCFHLSWYPHALPSSMIGFSWHLLSSLWWLLCDDFCAQNLYLSPLTSPSWCLCLTFTSGSPQLYVYFPVAFQLSIQRFLTMLCPPITNEELHFLCPSY